jgi:hypothetical protein
MFQLCQLAWHADVVEKNGLFACSMGDDASGEEKKAANDDCITGGVGSCAAAAVVAGA